MHAAKTSIAALTFSVAATLFAGASFAAEPSVKLQKKDVPEAVMAAFKAAYPQAKVNAYLRETRDGKTVYELESTEKNVKRDIIYSGAGEALEIEEGLSPSALPEPVKAAVAKAHPGRKITAAEKVMKGSSTMYEAMIQVDGKKVTLLFLADGTAIKP